MNTNKINQFLSLLFIFSLLAAGAVYAASSVPSMPTQLDIKANTTNAYPNGTSLSYTRGFIYLVNISESQPTQKWIGYVGNVSGEYALQDASGNALYDWPIGSITGEIYATREGGAPGGYDDDTRSGGGIPIWGDLICANTSMITTEQGLFNHTSTDEDSYENTFNDTGFTNPTFYAGENQIDDNTIGGDAANCFGAYMNKNNADQSSDWVEVVLTDTTYQEKSSAENTVFYYDLIYASLLENNVAGFDGTTYDFQMIIPQSGLEGFQAVVPFYFYVELI